MLIAALSVLRRSSKSSISAPAASGSTTGTTGRCSLPAHSSGSRPSTWSVPVSPRAASSTTSSSAVVAKLMTIAVSTSACGSGSAKRAGSSRRAGLDDRRPPAAQPSHGEDEEVDRVREQRQADR